MCLEVQKLGQATCSAERVWPLLLGAHQPPLPACLPFLLFAQRPVWSPGPNPCFHKLLCPPLASRLFCRHQAMSCWGVSVPLLEISVLLISDRHPTAQGGALKAPLPTGQDVSHFPLGGGWLGCPAVNSIVLLYFGTLLGLAEFFWFKCIIPSIQLELNFLGDYAESSAGA